MGQREHVARAFDDLDAGIGQHPRQLAADAPGRQRRGAALHEQHRHEERPEVLQARRLPERRLEIERHLGEARAERRAFGRRQHRPGSRPAPVVDEARHAALRVAVDQGARHARRDRRDFREGGGVEGLVLAQQVERDRLDQREAAQPAAVAQRDVQRNRAAVGMADQVDRAARTPQQREDDLSLFREAECATAPRSAAAAAVEVGRQDVVAAGQLSGERAPLRARRRGAVQQDDRLAGSLLQELNPSAAEIEGGHSALKRQASPRAGRGTASRRGSRAACRRIAPAA